MNSGTLFFILLLCTLFTISSVDGKKKKKARCTIPPAEVEVDDKWLETRSKEGWFIPLGSKLAPSGPKSEYDPTPPDKSTARKKRCWSALLKSQIGIAPLHFNCNYDVNNKQSCAAETAGTPLDRFVRYFGDFTTTLTDNENYLVIFACLQEKIDYWVVLSVTKTIDEETKTLILNHVHDMGYNTTNLMRNNDPLYIDRAKFIPCKDNKYNKKAHARDLSGEEDPETQNDKEKK